MLRKPKSAWVPGGTGHSHLQDPWWSPIVKDGFNETGGLLHQKSSLVNRIGKNSHS